jgi:hypothetical protein
MGKRKHPSKEEEQKAYYDRLVYQCRKDLNKQAKVCKTFECRKLIRKGKTDDLAPLKEQSLEPVIEEGLRRLGLIQTPMSTDAWVESILQQKRMLDAIEKWSDSVTEYNKFCHRYDKPPEPEEEPEKDPDKSQFVKLDEDDYAAVTKKKNRPGQRARLANALAKEAKKEGRRVDHSINWRPKNKEEPKEVVEEKEEIHPSWQAKKDKKEGIAVFKGTKITF